MGAKTVTTTIGLPITSSKEDQILLKRLDRLKLAKSFRSRTTLIRTLIADEWARVFPGVK